MVRPYAQKAVSQGLIADEQQFLTTLVNRKNNIKRSFSDFYDRLDAARTAKLAPTAPVGITRPGVLTQIDQTFVQAATNNGWAGKSLMVGGADIEGGNVLVYDLWTGASKRMLTLECKVRKEAEQRLLAKLGTVAPVPVSGPVAADPYWGDMLTTIKHINVHLKPGGDGILSPDKVNLVKNTAAKLLAEPDKNITKYYRQVFRDLVGHPPSEVVHADTATLTGWLKTKNAVGKTFKPYVPKIQPVAVPVAPTSMGGALTAQQVNPYMLKREFRDGKLWTDGTKTPLHGQVCYDIDLGGGMRATYIAQGDSNAYSKMGRLIINREGYTGTIAELEETYQQLGRLDLASSLATANDMELLYLQKVAAVTHVDVEVGFQQAVLDKITSSTTVEQQIKIHQAYWNNKLGVADVSKLSHYRPMPRYDAAWSPGKGIQGEGGWAWWERFDIDPKDFAKKTSGMGNYQLGHSLRTTSHDFLQEALEGGSRGTGWMNPTEERFRTGIFGGEGMSPAADQNSGGASYLFTRIVNMTGARASGYNLFFDRSLLLRTDNIIYGYDNFGNAQPGSRLDRLVDMDQWRKASGQTGNEACIKNGFSLVHYLRRVNVHNQVDKDRVVQLFKRNGITHLGTETVEDAVVVV